MNTTDARQAYADALSGVDGVSVRARPPVRNPKPGDGWVLIRRGSPADYRRSTLVLTAVVVLGTDVAAAEELIDSLAVPLSDAAAAIPGLPTADVAFEPDSLVLDGGGELNILTITATTEVHP